MDYQYLWLIYVFMFVATTIATIQVFDFEDFISSVICGILWPLFISVKILRKIIR